MIPKHLQMDAMPRFNKQGEGFYTYIHIRPSAFLTHECECHLLVSTLICLSSLPFPSHLSSLSFRYHPSLHSFLLDLVASFDRTVPCQTGSCLFCSWTCSFPTDRSVPSILLDLFLCCSWRESLIHSATPASPCWSACLPKIRGWLLPRKGCSFFRWGAAFLRYVKWSFSTWEAPCLLLDDEHSISAACVTGKSKRDTVAQEVSKCHLKQRVLLHSFIAAPTSVLHCRSHSTVAVLFCHSIAL